MTADDETLARIRAALDDSDRVDAARVEVARDGQQVVLRGAVATAEEGTAAAMIAERDADRVRSDLRVDAGLREATSTGAPPPTGQPAAAPSTSPEDPTRPADDLTANVEEALGENLAWDPPDVPASAPTRAEERGSPAGEASEAGEVEPSAGDLSAAELQRDARPTDGEDR